MDFLNQSTRFASMTVLLLSFLVSQVTKVISLSSVLTEIPVLYNPRLMESEIKALNAVSESQSDCVNSKESSRLFRSTFINASMVSEKSTEKQYEWILIQTNCYRGTDQYITKQSGVSFLFEL